MPSRRADRRRSRPGSGPRPSAPPPRRPRRAPPRRRSRPAWSTAITAAAFRTDAGSLRNRDMRRSISLRRDIVRTL